MSKFNEKFLRGQGFEEGSDGVWRKKDSAPPNPPSGADSEPDEKLQAHRAAPQVEKPPIRRLIAIVTIRTVRPRDYDGLGASAKYYFDALQHIGVIEDDSPEHIEIIYNPEKVSHFSEEETIIEIYEQPNDKDQP